MGIQRREFTDCSNIMRKANRPFCRIVKDGIASEVIQFYLSTARSANGEISWPDISKAPGNNLVKLNSVRILQEGIQGPTADVDIAKDITVEITYRNLKEGLLLYSAIWLRSGMGVDILSSVNRDSVNLIKDDWYGRPHPKGTYKAVCRIPANFLNEGRYAVTAIVGMVPNETQVIEKDVLSFDVHDTGEMRKEFYGGWLGVVRPKLAWNTVFQKD